MDAQSMTMLIIDDEEKLLFGLKMLMQREGYRVITAKNGDEGLKLIREAHPDVIICDVMMPPPNGFMLKKILMEDTLTADIPFIFLTARTLEADRVHGLNIGADDYISKPFKIEELLARIKAILRRVEHSRMQGKRDAQAELSTQTAALSTNFNHELRTPLGIIINTLDLAIQDQTDGTTTDMDWYLHSAQNSAQQLRGLVDDLLILKMLDEGQMPRLRQLIDLRFDFVNPIQVVLEKWKDKQLVVDLSIDPGVVVHAPRSEFSRAAAHLVDNACKFGPEASKVTIRLEKNGVGGCILRVEDQGNGIPMDQREKVFERYYQISQGNTRAYGGMGVGLTIVKVIAEALGGSITILDSEKGARVQMIIPPGPNDWVTLRPKG